MLSKQKGNASLDTECLPTMVKENLSLLPSPIKERDSSVSLENVPLESRIRQAAQISGMFTLRSGAVSNTYFDKYQFEADPQLLEEIAVALKNLLPTNTEAIAGLEMGGIPIATMLSHVSKLPCAFIRKQPKQYGTCKFAEGTNLINKKFVLIEDVVSSGGAVVDAINVLKQDNLFPAKVLCVIDRKMGGKQNIESCGIPFESIFEFPH